MTQDTPTVLIISDEADFSRRITARWQMERNVPTFTLLSGELWPRVAILKHDAAWLETLVLAAAEAVHRSRAEARARAAEAASSALERQAMLGRYMLEMRHNLNNALTSVLGNSDLLLLEPGSFSAQTRAQIETIRNMSLRIHEIMQRFSSLEKEMNVAAQLTAADAGKLYAGAASAD